MAEHLKNSTLPHVLTDLVGDLADLVQKELRLAKVEVSDKVATKLRGSLWLVVAGVIGFVVFLLLVQAAVFAIASFGFAMHWSCLIVAAVLAAAAVGIYAKARAGVQEGLTPSRTIHQIQQDVRTAKEQLT